MADGFIFYSSFADAINMLDDADRLAAYDAVVRYAIYGEEPDKTIGVAYAIFLMAKPQVDANAKKREDGKKGGRPKVETSGYENKKPVVLKSETSGYVNSKPKEKDKDKVKDKEKEIKEREKSPEVVIATLDAPAEIKVRLQGFVDMRKKIKKPMTGNAVSLLWGRVQKLESTTEKQCALLDQSIRNGWQDVYPLKTEDNKRASPNRFNSMMQHDYDFDSLEKQLVGV